MKEIKLGKMHYVEDPSGFWVSVNPTDPMSATVTKGELLSLVNDYREHLKLLIERAVVRLNELDAFMEYHS